MNVLQQTQGLHSESGPQVGQRPKEELSLTQELERQF